MSENSYLKTIKIIQKHNDDGKNISFFSCEETFEKKESFSNSRKFSFLGNSQDISEAKNCLRDAETSKNPILLNSYTEENSKTEQNKFYICPNKILCFLVFTFGLIFMICSFENTYLEKKVAENKTSDIKVI